MKTADELLASAAALLQEFAVAGGRLDYMCQACGGDDGDLGGSRVVTHHPECRFMQWMDDYAEYLGGAITSESRISDHRYAIYEEEPPRRSSIRP